MILRIVWRQADALRLPFEDKLFDVVACQFGVMFFPDKIQGYREARRVLKSGGCFLFKVWTKIRRTSSPTSSRTRWQPCFHKIHRVSWRAPRMAIILCK